MKVNSYNINALSSQLQKYNNYCYFDVCTSVLFIIFIIIIYYTIYVNVNKDNYYTFNYSLAI